MVDSGTYSKRWFELFLEPIPDENSNAETEFLERHLPLAAYPRILDVCCGPGRHASRLSARGYRVVGVDRDSAAIQKARTIDTDGTYHCCDVRALPAFDHAFDAVICMWASFGWFTDVENDRVLRDLVRVLRPGGRLVLDLYNADFFRSGDTVRERIVDGVRIVERRRVTGDRLHVTLDYEGGGHDAFEWQIFTPAEMSAVMRGLGCEPVLACAGFRTDQPPSADIPRMQLVFAADAVAALR